MVECYIGLGGNLGGTLSAMKQAIALMREEKGIRELRYSRLYVTTPVFDGEERVQPDFLNAACRFETELSVERIGGFIERITRELGQPPKPKNSPRLIDLDLLFYGSLIEQGERWIIPHPRWHERLFVIQPLSDLSHELPFGLKVEEILLRFSNPHREKVTLSQYRLDDARN